MVETKKSANCKSTNYRALSAKANPQISYVSESANRKFLSLIPKSQTRKFLQNTAQLCLIVITVLKVVFLFNFIVYTF